MRILLLTLGFPVAIDFCCLLLFGHNGWCRIRDDDSVCKMLCFLFVICLCILWQYLQHCVIFCSYYSLLFFVSLNFNYYQVLSTTEDELLADVLHCSESRQTILDATVNCCSSFIEIQFEASLYFALCEIITVICFFFLLENIKTFSFCINSVNH